MAKQSQVDKFRKAARARETDDSEKHFNEKVGKIAKQKPGALLKKPPRAKTAK